MEHIDISIMAQEIHRGSMNLKNLSLFIVVLLFCFIFLELFLRIFLPQNMNIYQYNEDYVFEFLPGAELVYERGEFSQKIKFNN